MHNVAKNIAYAIFYLSHSYVILHVGQILEDFQISQSQIVAYKKQLDSCKKELEEERRRGQQLEAEVHVQCIICTRLPGITWYDIQHTNILHQSLETVTLRELAHLVICETKASR